MKKRFLALLLVLAMAAMALTACSKKNPSGTQGGNDGNSTASTEKPTLADYGSGTITVWVAENVVEFTKKLCDDFFKANPDMAGYTVEIQPQGEGEAATNMITDVQGGADVYAFAQDQLARLVAANAIMPLSGYYENFVKTQNDSGAAGAAVAGGVTYAFPFTSDNGYFLYYDKSVITDPTSLDQIIADCEKAGKNFYMEINSGWYQTAFFFATGTKIEYTMDDKGAFTGADITYATPEGLTALKAIVNMAKSSSFQNGSSANTATNYAAIIDGIWDKDLVQQALGENFACAKLPKFTVDGKDYQMSGFGGFKLMGVKPQTEQGKQLVCLALAEYLTNAESQLARFAEVGWGPSNITAQADSAIAADPALSALAEQLALTIPQGNYPQAYWDGTKSFGGDIISGNFANLSDDDLMKKLQELQDITKAAVTQ